VTTSLRTAAQRDLSRVAPSSTVISDGALVDTYARDRADGVVAGTPLAVVLVGDVRDAASVLRWANANAIPVVPRGAGSGLSGGANAVDGGVSLILDRLTEIRDLDVTGLTATVQAGVLTGNLKAAAASRGLYYPPDPASAAFCTIGGNIATNAGGLCCVKYGVTRDWVQQIEALLIDGTSIRVGRSTRKDVAGYDLRGLLIGSEGTLAVVTGATLRLRAAAAKPLTMVATFGTLDAAADAVVAITSGGPVPSMLEILDSFTLRAVEMMEPMGLDVDSAALLVIQSDATDSSDELTLMERACLAAGADYTARASDAVEADMLLHVRRQAFPALEHQGRTLLDDVAVPIPAMPDLLRGIQDIAVRHDVHIGTFGHAGDGNLHPTIVIPRGDVEAASRAEGAFADILQVAIGLGGTVTGEHGVGSLKTPWLRRSIGPSERRIQEQIKKVFDPQGLLNPGKAILTDDDQMPS
jgi:glycolate oxidase